MNAIRTLLMVLFCPAPPLMVKGRSGEWVEACSSTDPGALAFYSKIQFEGKLIPTLGALAGHYGLRAMWLTRRAYAAFCRSHKRAEGWVPTRRVMRVAQRR